MSFGLMDAIGVGVDLLGSDDDGGGLGGMVGDFLGSDGGDLGGMVSDFLGSDSDGVGGLVDNFLGSDSGGIGGLIDNFAGSSDLGDMIGGVMGGDGIGDAVTGFLGGTDAGSVVTDFLGDSGLGSGVSDILSGGGGGGWLGGLSESVGAGDLGGIATTVADAVGGDFGGIGGLADTLGDAVGGDFGGIAETIGEAAGVDVGSIVSGGGGGFFGRLNDVLDNAGDSFGSPGGILATVGELSGGGPSWLDDISSTVEDLGSTGLSDVFGATTSFVPPTFQDSFGTGGGLGEYSNWGTLASEGADALGLDLPDIGGAPGLGYLVAGTSDIGLPEGAQTLVPEPVAGMVDDLLGDAAAVADSLAPVDSAASAGQEANVESAIDPPAQAEVEVADALDDALDPVPDFEPEPVADIGSDTLGDPAGPLEAHEEPMPEDELEALNEAVEAADEIESSVDDLFEGL